MTKQREATYAKLRNWAVQECQNLAQAEKTEGIVCISMRILVTSLEWRHKIKISGTDQNRLIAALRQHFKESGITIKN